MGFILDGRFLMGIVVGLVGLWAYHKWSGKSS